MSILECILKQIRSYGRNAHIPTRSIRLIPVENPPLGPLLRDPPTALRRTLKEIDLASLVSKGDRVAVTAGSRGIDRIALVLKTLVDELKGLAAIPFICPAMGSHGGGTAAGRAALLEHLGVTEKTVGAPVLVADGTVTVDTTPSGVPLYMSRPAFEADKVIAVNRVKPHTRFTGAIQSGLCKMMLVGLGNRSGARTIHAAALRTPFERIAREALPIFAAKTPLTAGIALVENGEKKLASLAAARADGFTEVDATLLTEAAKWMPRIPAKEIDLLLVDRFGKEISGTGMDTNVIGRKEDAPLPRVLRIFAGDLTAASNGNATGIGFADAITRRCAEKIDHNATTINCFTAQRPEGARIPALFENDRDAIEALLATTGRRDRQEVKVARIASTASLDRIMMSPSLIASIEGNETLRIAGPAQPLRFAWATSSATPE